MWTRTVFTSVKIPPHILHWYSTAFYLANEFLVAFLSYGTAYDFSNLWEQHICTLYSLSIFVNLHIESLDILRIVCHDDWFPEVMFYKESLMLTCKVHTP